MSFLLDFVLFAINAFLLLLQGASDLKFRGIPLPLLAIHCLLALGILVFRLSTVEFSFITQVYLPLGILALVLLAIYFSTGFIGESDLIIIISSGAVAPYIAVGYLRYLGIITPLAIVTSSAYLLYKYWKTTSTVYLTGIGKIRARLRYAIDFKVGNLLKNEIPVYIEGYGAIPRKSTRKPENIKAILEKIHDYAVVYSVPNYPYIYYYSVSYIAIYLVLTTLSIALSLVFT